MKLKSHLHLSKRILAQSQASVEGLQKLSFSIGNLWPDLNLSFLTRAHTPKTRMDEVCLQLDRQIHQAQQGYLSYFQLGKLCHFLADFFCSVHNEPCGKRMRYHRSYEKQLHHMFTHESFTPTRIILGLQDTASLGARILSLWDDYQRTPLNHQHDLAYIHAVCLLSFRCVLCNYCDGSTATGETQSSTAQITIG